MRGSVCPYPILILVEGLSHEVLIKFVENHFTPISTLVYGSIQNYPPDILLDRKLRERAANYIFILRERAANYIFIILINLFINSEGLPRVFFVNCVTCYRLSTLENLYF